jgi:hypothetical protein
MRIQSPNASPVNLMETVQNKENANKTSFSCRTTTRREVKIQLNRKLQEQNMLLSVHCVSTPGVYSCCVALHLLSEQQSYC